MHRKLMICLALMASADVAGTDTPMVGRTPIGETALAPVIEALSEQVDDAAQSRRAAGFGLALLIDGEVRWLRATGLADRARGTPFDPDTPMALGEISRLYLAALAADSADRGLLDLDAPVTRWLPNFAPRSRFPDTAIRVRDLLTHHSGLSYGQLHGTYRESGHVAASLDPAAWYLVLAPRTAQLTSNLGYEALAQVIEAASGRSPDALFRERFAAPLGLTRSGWTAQPGLASTHRKGRVEPRMLAREHAALGMQASLRDLARFVAALMPGDLHAASPLSASARAEMTRVQNADVVLDVGNHTGLGWTLGTSVRPGVGRVASAFGVFPATRVDVRLALDHGLGVVAMANWDESDDVLFDAGADALDRLLVLRAATPPRQRDRRLPDQVPLPARASIDAPAPRYATFGGLVTTRVRDAESFELEFADLEFRADARGDGWFALRYDLFGVLPIGFSRLDRVAIAPARIGGERVLLGYGRDRHVLLGSAFETDAAGARHAQWTGTYRLRNPDPLSRWAELEEATLSYADGLLTLDYEVSVLVTLRPRLPLLWLRDGVFVVAGRGPNQGEEVHLDTRSDPPRIRYSGYVLEREPD
jgi:CubicO group peptidase (beta-lactamase class C family)